MIKVVTRKDVKFSETVREAYQNGLFIPSYVFEQLLTEFDDYIHSMCIIYDENPIALAMTWNYPWSNEEHIGVYVKPGWRRLGYGTTAIEALGGIKNRVWNLGNSQSGEFWLNFGED